VLETPVDVGGRVWVAGAGVGWVSPPPPPPPPRRAGSPGATSSPAGVAGLAHDCDGVAKGRREPGSRPGGWRSHGVRCRCGAAPARGSRPHPRPPGGRPRCRAAMRRRQWAGPPRPRPPPLLRQWLGISVGAITYVRFVARSVTTWNAYRFFETAPVPPSTFALPRPQKRPFPW